MKYITTAVLAAIIFIAHNARGEEPQVFKEGTTSKEISDHKASAVQAKADIGEITADVKTAYKTTKTANDLVGTQRGKFSAKIEAMKEKVQAVLDKQEKEKGKK
ncbi:MAG TPA: hypothetical protein QGF02_02180 [Candidatus Babeliales bacterium]|nr:hypothetical protein [Candidatus Babeliales bacterium]